MYKTDHEVVDNDPIEQEIVDMVPRAKGFYEDSGKWILDSLSLF